MRAGRIDRDGSRRSVGTAALAALTIGALALALVSVLAGRGPLARGEEPPLMRAAEATNPESLDWSEPIEVAAGEAYQGPWRMNESDFRYVDAPAVALDGGADAAVVWVDQARKDVFFQRYGTDGVPGLEAAVNVSRSADTFSWLPRVAVPSERPQEVYVAWQEIVFSGGSHGGEIFFARSSNGGRDFSSAENLSRTPAGAGKGRLTARRWDNGSLDLQLGPGQEVYVAWTEYEGALRFRRSGDGGRTFDPPVRVGGDERRPARGPSLAVAPASGDGSPGRIYLAWTVGEDPSADIHLAVSDDGGRSFRAPRPVHEREGHADGPTLAVDVDGTVHLAFGESPDGPFGHYRILYARSTDGGDRFEEPRDISGPHGEAFESVNFPSLGLDGNGRLHLVWELYRDRREHSRGLGFTSSVDGGSTFETPTVVPGTSGPELGLSGSLQGMLTRKLAVAEDGRVAVVNSTFLPGRASRVRLVRGRPAG